MSKRKSITPYDAPELYDLLFDSLDFDIPYWLKVAREAGGPVLEIGCVTGRVEGKPLSNPEDQMIAWAWRDS